MTHHPPHPRHKERTKKGATNHARPHTRTSHVRHHQPPRRSMPHARGDHELPPRTPQRHQRYRTPTRDPPGSRTIARNAQHCAQHPHSVQRHQDSVQHHHESPTALLTGSPRQATTPGPLPRLHAPAPRSRQAALPSHQRHEAASAQQSPRSATSRTPSDTSRSPCPRSAFRHDETSHATAHTKCLPAASPLPRPLHREGAGWPIAEHFVPTTNVGRLRASAPSKTFRCPTLPTGCHVSAAPAKTRNESSRHASTSSNVLRRGSEA